MNHLLEAWHKTATVPQNVYRGLWGVVIPEGVPVTAHSILSAMDSYGRANPHWTTDISVARSFSRASEPRPVPGMMKGPGGVEMESPYYSGPRGTGVSVVLEGYTDAEDDKAWRDIVGVEIASEKEVTFRPGTPITLTAVEWYAGGKWNRELITRRITAALPDSPTWDMGGGYESPNAGSGKTWESIPGIRFEVRPNRVLAFSDELGDTTFAGHLSWYSDGTISGVTVWKDYRRMGLATELLRRAREVNPNVRHSETLTGDGLEWAHKTAMAWRGVVFHKVPGREGDLSGQNYWAEVDGIRWDIESSREQWSRTMWTAHRLKPGTRGMELDDHIILYAWNRNDLIDLMLDSPEGGSKL